MVSLCGGQAGDGLDQMQLNRRTRPAKQCPARPRESELNSPGVLRRAGSFHESTFNKPAHHDTYRALMGMCPLG
jgi:hypothetical protein